MSSSSSSSRFNSNSNSNPNPNSKVTITLGRRGQVVKSADMKISGQKRPISTPMTMRDRLGPNPSLQTQTNNKRHRPESNAPSHAGGLFDQHIGEADLRLRLIQKGITKKPVTFNGEVDLREKLLRKLPKKAASSCLPNHTMEIERERQRQREIIKQRERETDLPARRVATTRPADNSLPCPSWLYDTRDELHAIHRGGRSLTPPRPPPLKRPYVDLGPAATAAVCSSRPCSSGCGLKRGSDLVGGSRVASDYATNGVAGMEMRKTILPPSLPQKQQPELPATVDELLTSLELDKYKITFKAEEVDIGALKQMGDSDLKELGIPMGPRKKILLAVRSSSKQRPL
ncbi:Sterile alpha motif (SAM) domain-containing protein [Rhynchospora pubera]|uniref:Sterile alpha motif (SAM) domain-containing protein n=1 Tax=Rhynchospora pubera TaxID=906938 RepID=A0AAV8DGH7_9POAL|nr:Sterile alpha motif (SAM) domain-containing protein [Rhynchospora pubera]KAJ4765323.1 Sterile alpha motif (SAM) domain-containing protein [Rhynchospora pubera]